MGIHESARRENLRQLIELGVDPWGQRFDDRHWIGDVRSRATEVRFRRQDGTECELPQLEGEGAVDYRQWKSEQGQGEEVGPAVRVAGRIVLQRPTG